MYRDRNMHLLRYLFLKIKYCGLKNNCKILIFRIENIHIIYNKMVKLNYLYMVIYTYYRRFTF